MNAFHFRSDLVPYEASDYDDSSYEEAMSVTALATYFISEQLWDCRPRILVFCLAQRIRLQERRSHRSGLRGSQSGEDWGEQESMGFLLFHKQMIYGTSKKQRESCLMRLKVKSFMHYNFEEPRVSLHFIT
jgi:hypothetical protein